MSKVVSQSQHFRFDIQGLRGIAVLLVVIYHTGVALPGGYIGVDMFFVISGFVITQLLVRETHATNKISLIDFYSRRVRRILPAVSFTIVGTLFLSIFALSPFGEQQQIAETARASTFFAANFYFYLQDSYWALGENPLRHLWSLAVEEQFYIFFPVLLLTFHKLKIKVTSRISIAILLITAFASFIVSYYLSLGSQILPRPELFAFFGTPWRIWQFLAGALVALAPRPKMSLEKLALPSIAASAMLLGWASISFNSYTPFPGSAALAPVASTMAFIYFGQSRNFLTKIISAKPLQAVGDISYSWYLWHWPLIVFARRVFPTSEMVAPVGAALLAIAIAAISLHKIENPIRYNPKIQGKRALQLGAACVLLPLIFSFGIQKLSDTGLGLNELRNDSAGRTSYADARSCRIDIALDNSSSECDDHSQGLDAKRILLVGDSAAGSISDAIARVAKTLEFNFSVYYANSCPVTARAYRYRENCERNFKAINDHIDQLDPEVLVIANMSDLFVNGSGLGKTIVDFDGNPARNTDEALKFWIAGLSERIERDFLNRKVLVVQQPPLSAMREPILLQRLIDEQISLDNSDDRNIIVRAEAKLFKNYKNVAVFDPATVLCGAENCRQTSNGDALYYDGRHLTVKGSLLMVGGIIKALQPLLAND